MPETIEAPASLRDRVQSLRLPDRANAGAAGRGGRLPWALCLLLAASTASLAARVYTAPAADPAAAQPDPGAAAKDGAATGAGAAPTSAAGGAKAPAPAGGAVVLESKGYVIAAHLIQVSP